MGPALDQDGPGCVSAIDLDALARGDSELSRLKFPAQLLAEQIQHHTLSVTLLLRAARRQLASRLDRSSVGKHGHPGNASTGSSQDAIRLPVVVPKPLVNDLPVRAGSPSHDSGVLQFAADLVYPLPGRDAGPVCELIVVKRTRTDAAYRLADAVAMAAGLHARQYVACLRRHGKLRDDPADGGGATDVAEAAT